MELVYLFAGVILGALVGILFAGRKATVPKAEHDALLNREVIAQAKVQDLGKQLEEALRNVELAKRENFELSGSLGEFRGQLPSLYERIQRLEEEKRVAEQFARQSEQEKTELSARNASFATEKKNLQEQLEQFRTTLDEMRKVTKTEFELLAKNILEGNSKAFSENSKEKLEVLLNPLRDKLEQFEKKVEEKYSAESVERGTLKNEIERLITHANKITAETTSLTQALKGDSKFQGDWGEMVLERILEESGLREDADYTLQEQHRDGEGERFKPDVVVKLPDNKHIIVDSKVSLTAYARFIEAEKEEERETHLKAHVKSVQKHIDELSEKGYQNLKGVNSPEFVLMFVPVEAAYLVAMRSEKDLIQSAWKKRVAIVTATTLLTTMKTIASLWRVEKQNKNALEIASEAANLYDKFVSFLEDFEKIERTLQTGQKQYSDAMNKLRTGQGNVFRKIEKLKDLGASPKKLLRPELLE